MEPDPVETVTPGEYMELLLEVREERKPPTEETGFLYTSPWRR